MKDTPRLQNPFLLISVIAISAIVVLLNPVAGAEPVVAGDRPVFSLTDDAGRRWVHELVEYPLDAHQINSIKGCRLVDGEAHETVYQLDPDRKRILFQASVPPFGKSVYSFDDSPPKVSTDLTVTETDGHIELSNSRTGIRLAKRVPPTGVAAPILGWRLASGKWVGGTRFVEAQTIAHYSISIVERGPVRARVLCRVQFGNGDTWNIDLELQAGEPVVLVHESFDCREPRSFTFDLTGRFPAASVFSRSSSRQPLDGQRYEYGTYINQKLDGKNGTLVTLEPWLRWGAVPTRTTSFSWTDADWRDVVFMATCAPEKWVDPEIESEWRAPTARPVVRNSDGSLTLTYELAKGQRKYLIGSVPGKIDRSHLEEHQRKPTQAQVYQMKYSDFPLDRVKDYTLRWQSAGDRDTSFLSREQQKELLADFEVDAGTLDALRRSPVTIYGLEELLPYYLATHDRQLERKLIEFSLAQVQSQVDSLVKLEDGFVTFGFAPHSFLSFITVCNLVSVIDDSPQMTPAERQRLRAQLALLGYLFNRDAYWSTAREFNGFPNMTAAVYGIRAAIADVVPNHPLQRQWMQQAVHDLKAEFLDRWSDQDGNWNGAYTESFSYTRVTLDLVLGALYRAYRSGIDTESLFHPTIRHMGQWLAEVATPRDARVLNWRHDPPVGNDYRFDMLPSLFAMLAVMWKDRDPEFAGHMKWMQLEQGNRQLQAVGGFHPSFAGYRKLFMANSVTPRAARYESRHWNESGVILRNHYGQPLENMLYLIAGRGHTHYDQDSGSITLWGKGEVIADDFGYYGYAAGEDHNMLDTQAAPPRDLMRVTEFSTNELVDFVRGEKKDWTRRIFFVKHEQPEGPNYFVIQDALAVPVPASWRMWFASPHVTIDGQRIHAAGLHRVDTDMYFAGLPEGALITREKKTRRPSGVDSEGRYLGAHPVTQTGVIVTAPRYRRMLALVYPRLKSKNNIEESPKVSSIAGGQGFKIATRYGTDYVFLADEPISFEEGQLSFHGTAGFARISPDNSADLDLKSGGMIAYRDQRLSRKAAPGELRGTNRIADGELTSGDYSIFPQQNDRSVFTVSVQKGSPLPGPSTLNGEYCQKVSCDAEVSTKSRHLLPATVGTVWIDRQRVWRIQARVYLPGANQLVFSSYARDENGKQLKNAKGHVWAWSLPIQGPTDGFQNFETTVGPAGSDAEHIFPPETMALAPLGCRLYGQGNTFYIDDLVIESAGK